MNYALKNKLKFKEVMRNKISILFSAMVVNFEIASFV